MATRKLQRPLQLLLHSFRTSASLAAAPRPLRSSSAAAELPLSRSLIDSFRSWRSGHRSPPFPSSSFGCLSSTIGLHCLLHRGTSVLRASLQRRALNARRFFSLPQSLGNALLTPDGVVYGLIGANVAVFVLWRIADTAFMKDNFMLSLHNIKNWRLHTMLTSAFSHADADHLITNMIALYFFGISIAKMFGAEFLLTLYFAGALGGSIFFLVHKAILSQSSEGVQGFYYSRVPALGASAAVNLILLLDIFLFPKSVYYLYLVISVPAVLMGVIFVGTDLWRMTKSVLGLLETPSRFFGERGDKRVSGEAHLGGAVVAALVGARIKGWI